MDWKQNSRSALPRLAAVLMTTLCAGCVTSGQISPISVARTLPPAPAFARPVKVAPPKVGEDILVVAARERAGRAKANDIIRCQNDWYAVVKEAYGQGMADRGVPLASNVCKRMQARKKKP